MLFRSLADCFNWGVDDFLAVNLTALEAFAVSENVRRKLKQRLVKGYRAVKR